MDILERIGAVPAGGYAPAKADEPKKLADTPSGQLRDLLAEDFKFQLLDVPEFATQAGFHEHDDKVQKLRPYRFDQKVERNKATLVELAAIDKSGLSKTELLYVELFTDAVEGENRGIELGAHLMPLNSVGNGGVHESFIEVMEWMKFDNEEDIKVYLARLMSFRTQVDDFCDLLAYGAGRGGRPASASMMRRIPARLKELVASDLDDMHACIEGRDFEIDEELAMQVKEGVYHCFKGGCQKLHDFLDGYYKTKVRESPSCGKMKDGVKLYNECLRFHSTTTKSAQEIHDLGLKEVARIEGRFQTEVLDKLDFKGSFTEFAGQLKADPQWFYTSETELVDGYKELMKKIEAILPTIFEKLPKTPLEIVPKQGGPAAYYYAGTADGSRPGRFYVNVSRLSTRPKFEMMALALHEGLPGHHLQGALALENPEIPDFLRYIEDRRYEYGPARRPLYTGYLEGWALYCERLGEDLGMYTTPYDLFGRLSMEMMRAVRLVVDTGIHAFDWSVEDAAKYMEEKTGMAKSECEEECHRYAAWPGQAVAYKVGQLAIEEMRAEAEAKLGDKFKLSKFHELVLANGPQPLNVLARHVQEWTAKQA